MQYTPTHSTSSLIFMVWFRVFGVFRGKPPKGRRLAG
jgi:hypothetical protein